MLSAAPLTPGRGRYLEETVASGREDYYAGRGESPGRWFGAAAATLGLHGVVADGALERLIDGCDPTTGVRLRRAIAARTIHVASVDPETGGRIIVEQRLEPVGGFDFVFSAPKSISLAAALGDDDTRRAVVAAHHAAVHQALRLLEREACGVRLGAGGKIRLPGSGIVAGLYTHRVSRELDPQLHTHCAIANLTQGPDERWRTLDSRRLLCDWKRPLGFAYQAALRREITTRLGWTWNEPAKGMAELAAWPTSALREFSQRRLQIEQAISEHGASGWHATQIATLATRTRKTLPTGTMEQEHANWRARLAEHGMPSAHLTRALTPAIADASAPDEELLVAIATGLAGAEGLTAKQNTFTRADVICHFAGALREGTTTEHLSALADWFLAQRPFVTTLDDERYTTPDLLATERRLLALADEGRDTDTAVAARVHVQAAIDAAAVPLSAEQRIVIRRLTQSGHAIENLEALAGTGKTTVCGVIADAYTRAGYTVIGATPTARAARELRSVGVDAHTIDALLAREKRRPTPAPARLVVIADENGMSGTRQMTALTEWARESGAKIIQVGDSHQLQGVPASGAFAEITRRHGAAQLTTVRRQRDPEEIDALANLRAGLADRYLTHQIQHDRVHTATTDAATSDAAAWWVAAAAEHGVDEVAIITRDNTLRDQLNHRVRRDRLTSGEITGPAVHVGDHAFQRGDRVICRRNDHRLTVDNGTRATITATSPDHGAVAIRTDDGRIIRLPGDYLAAGHLEHAYALTAHSLQGATLETTCLVTRPDDHDTRWTYTAASRARGHTHHLLISNDHETASDTLARAVQTMSRDHDDELAHVRAPSPPVGQQPERSTPGRRLGAGISR